MAIIQDLSPALVRDDGDIVEALTVDITVKKNANYLCNSLWSTGERFSG